MTATLDTVPTAPTEWARALYRGLGAYLVSRVLVLLGVGVGISAHAVRDRWEEKVPVEGLRAVVQALDSWDGHWYLDVTRMGYPRVIRPEVTYFVSDARAAFFPLFPRTVRYLDFLLPGGPVSAALLLNFVLGAVFVWLIGLIARELHDTRTAEKTMVIAALFPGSFVLSWTYSEALMLTLAALVFLALARRRWVLAGVLAAFGTATRPNAVALVAACAVASLIAIKRDRDWRSLWAPALSPIGFVGFMAFLRHHTGEPWPWFRVQREAWREGTSFGGAAVTRTVDFFVNPVSSPTSMLTTASVGALVLGIWCLRRHRLPAGHTAYSAVVIFLMLLPATVTARPRFLFTAFPLLIPAARQLRDDDSDWWPLTVLVLGAGLVTVTGLYVVFGAIP
ncbi:MAG: glycosyltransferase family 39 protein [Acidimicrobiales bacterium]